MAPRALLLAGAVVLVGVPATVLLRGSPGNDLPIASAVKPGDREPAKCPWRDPEKDMRAFFPGATAYRTDLLPLSRYRAAILAKLGPGVPLETNVFYAYRVLRGERVVGTVLVRRAAGEYGAIELVLGVDDGGRVVGARIQRQREPRATGEVITSTSWLGAFRGKTADSAWKLGADVPAVPEQARQSAATVVRAARSLLIEYESGAKAGPAAPHIHVHAGIEPYATYAVAGSWPNRRGLWNLGPPTTGLST